ncbi:sugar transferase [Micromonospora sp. HM5-17]|uniref:sugar transferase n=1 Tax=Micromonospora sp. HM5-17 TaxID=2487710 RepID=UPI00267D82CA|nr:sugar transferase [Micromonospora sp. HM5-17]
MTIQQETDDPRLRHPGPAPSRPADRAGYERSKRLLDLVIAVVLLLLAAPVMAVVAVAIAATLGRPVLFRQVRPGRYGELFELVKFRTMRPVDLAAGVVSDRDRLSRLGRWLRSTSLDELPTLWNVVRGEMSLVGPRPLLVEYLDRYTPTEARRHEVRPGITGLAQVRGRNELSFTERFRHDVWYVDNRSLALDLRILVETVSAVLRRRGITAPGCTTSPTFTGSAVVAGYPGGGDGVPIGPDGREIRIGPDGRAHPPADRLSR